MSRRLAFVLMMGLSACAPAERGADRTLDPAPDPVVATGAESAGAESAGSTSRARASTSAKPNACLGLGDPVCTAEGSDQAATNIDGGELAVCSRDPLTGFFRDGRCNTGATDRGVHVVCAQVTDEFLAFTAARGNDLSTPAPDYGFPGLEPGDRWCLCAARWREAYEAGVVTPVDRAATHRVALRLIDDGPLQAAALPRSD